MKNSYRVSGLAHLAARLHPTSLAIISFIACTLAHAPAGASFPPPRSFVAPPFENLTGEPDLDWIGEGFSRTLVEKLNVIAEFSAAHIRARDYPADGREIDISRLLSAAGGVSADAVIFGAVIKGSDVDRLDDPLEVTVRLVDIRTTEQVASLELVGRVREIFAMEADLAARVAFMFGFALSPAEEELLRTDATRSLQAYKETILGTMYLEDERYEQAMEMFEQAIEHHPGIFYPKAHNLLARAYMLSGKKEEMLERFKKDAASISSVYYDLATAHELNGNFKEARKNLELFLKYTDNLTIHWRRRDPGMELLGGIAEGLLQGDGDGASRLLSWETGREIPSEDRSPSLAEIAEGSEGHADVTSLIPENERGALTAGPTVWGEHFYYGLENGYLIGRSRRSGERAWAFRLRDKPAGKMVAGEGRLAVADAGGGLHCLGVHETPDVSDLSAYLKMAEISRRLEEREEAEALYRYIVEEVKYNVPDAWRALWDMARERGDTVTAEYRFKNYQDSQY